MATGHKSGPLLLGGHSLLLGSVGHFYRIQPPPTTLNEHQLVMSQILLGITYITVCVSLKPTPPTSSIDRGGKSQRGSFLGFLLGFPLHVIPMYVVVLCYFYMMGERRTVHHTRHAGKRGAINQPSCRLRRASNSQTSHPCLLLGLAFGAKCPARLVELTPRQ